VIPTFWDARSLEHRGPWGFPESPERLAGIIALLRERGAPLHEAAPTANLEAAVLAVHDEAYVRRFERAGARGDGFLDSADNPLSAGTWSAAWGGAAAAVAAVDWVLAAPRRRAFAATRPPGHHAEHDRAMGFCYFANAAIAAQRAIDRHGVERVAIFDFDVHHGNGTQHLFESRPDVLYSSTHQYPFYPGTGARSEQGSGAGRGFTVNVPLPAGSGDEAYGRAIAEEIEPALRRFEPQLLVVSAGFDAWRDDPLGGMRVSLQGFADWSRALARIADEVCDGRLLSLLEGGYDLAALPSLVEAHLAALSVELP